MKITLATLAQLIRRNRSDPPMKHPRELTPAEVREMSDKLSKHLKAKFGNNRMQLFMFNNRDIMDEAFKEMYLSVCEIIVRSNAQ